MKNKKHLALLILLLGQLLTILDIFIVNIAIPTIQEDLSASSSSIQLLVSMYMVGFASFLIIGGKAGDHYGRKNIYILGLFLFMISSACCGFAASIHQLIALRFLQGISAAFMSPQVLSYIQELFTEHQERTYAIGWYGITIGLGTMLGQFLGGFLLTLEPIIIQESWRYIFLVNIPICALTIIAALPYLAASKERSSQKMDYLSASILSLGLIALVFMLTIGLEQERYLLFLLGALSVVLLSIFVLRQKERQNKGWDPLLNLHLFKHKNFNISLIAVSLFMFMLDAYFFVLAIYLQDAVKLPPMQAGYFIVFQGIGFILASLVAARLILYYGKSILIVGVFAIIGALIAQAFLFQYAEMGIPAYMVMVLHGAGVALVLPSFANIALKGLPEDLMANASGLYSTVQQLFGALGIACTGGLFYLILNKNNHLIAYNKAFSYATSVHIVCLLSVFLLLILLPSSLLPKKKNS